LWIFFHCVVAATSNFTWRLQQVKLESDTNDYVEQLRRNIKDDNKKQKMEYLVAIIDQVRKAASLMGILSKSNKYSRSWWDLEQGALLFWEVVPAEDDEESLKWKDILLMNKPHFGFGEFKDRTPKELDDMKPIARAAHIKNPFMKRWIDGQSTKHQFTNHTIGLDNRLKQVDNNPDFFQVWQGVTTVYQTCVLDLRTVPRLV